MESVDFWVNWFVWRDAMLVSLLSAASLSYLGVWVVVKRVVYVPLALSQVSSVGVVFAYLLGFWVGGHTRDIHGCGILLDPSWISLLFALGTAFWFARPHEDSSLSVVTAYLLSGAMVMILGGYVRQDLHDVQTVLFGNAVLVDTVQILYVGGGALVVLVVHALLHRRFLFVSFDPDARRSRWTQTVSNRGDSLCLLRVDDFCGHPSDRRDARIRLDGVTSNGRRSSCAKHACSPHDCDGFRDFGCWFRLLLVFPIRHSYGRIDGRARRRVLSRDSCRARTVTRTLCRRVPTNLVRAKARYKRVEVNVLSMTSAAEATKDAPGRTA